MLFDSFSDLCKDIWNEYFGMILDARYKVESSGVPLYPRYIIFTKYDGFYSMELLGAEISPPKSLITKKRNGGDIHRFFDLFGGNKHKAIFELGGGSGGFTGVCLAHPHDRDAVLARFPFIGLYESTLVRVDGDGSVFEFVDGFESVYIDQCYLINSSGNLYRCKNILFMAIFNSSIKSSEVKGFFEKTLGTNKNEIMARGIFTVKAGFEDVANISALQNVYITDGYRETLIGDILSSSPGILRSAFDVLDFVYEPYLEWVEKPERSTDIAINPDFIMWRSDGTSIILDLKLAKVDKKRLVKGDRKRRRFVDYVVEGISQLSNYYEYFDFEGNRSFAYKKYGIRIESPQLILVVGSMENLSADEVNEAMRAYRDISIIDYDTLVSSFLKADSGGAIAK